MPGSFFEKQGGIFLVASQSCHYRKKKHLILSKCSEKQLRKDSPSILNRYLLNGEREAQERSLESDSDEDSDTEEDNSFLRVLIAPNGSVYSLGVPLLAEYEDTSKSISEASSSEKVKAEPSTDPSFLDAEQSHGK
ncbi:unnamed protein product [Fraxinus pennsylvanica]|uniref:Uncharacterized protein n=1 Tax=Fraxinus pennsylvanica TaxID=56036 RepID=A0AAD2EEB6_9LAMI|nr:unnamed protein product [Fraxinus pennsylvanica]